MPESVGLVETLALRDGDMDELKVLVLQGEALTVPEDVEHTDAERESVGLVEIVVLAEEDMEREVLPVTQAVGVPVVETLTEVLPDCEVL